ncbi:MAG TPA: HD-GYP domain-containing protein [Bryobacteraceae bacterium]|nr:HD-GYP domain-containing protein [Bryobacteraceae bacterium]
MSGEPLSISDRACAALLETLAITLDARDRYTAGHSHRVAEYSCAIAQQMNLAPQQIEIIRAGAQLHDIGKIGIPDSVLLKNGPLTPEEFGLIKLHPQIGRRILEKAFGFESLLDIVELHHENFDGTGYPYGLAGARIPLEARIVRVADAFDAMTTDRSYRPAFDPELAREAIQIGSGREFDPEAASAFLNIGAVEGSLLDVAPVIRQGVPALSLHSS